MVDTDIRFENGHTEPFPNISLVKMEEILEDSRFLRVHHRHIVNLDKITVRKYDHIMLGIEKVPLGEKY